MNPDNYCTLEAVLGSRMFHSLRFYIFIGPYTFAWGDEPVEVVEVKE